MHNAATHHLITHIDQGAETVSLADLLAALNEIGFDEISVGESRAAVVRLAARVLKQTGAAFPGAQVEAR